ncbi:MAG TPA: S-adenosylmethionine:tRNA ribosyltransferase-isomerase [Flavisolibacter sp.]|nr:S-adenosylmethionine:tRNA ribosyltransferase-isomerase [Flavisolibacter sp.]
MNPQEIFISDYDYPLPPERIAAFPLEKREASKLLVYKEGRIQDDNFFNLPSYLPKDATLVLNNTRVIEARLFFQKPTGGIIEVFCLGPDGQTIEQALAANGQSTWQCLIGGASKWKAGQVLEKTVQVNGRQALLRASYLSKQSDHFLISFSWEPADISFSELLQAAGAIPLPPYIKRNLSEQDKERYQTVFGREQGSVAAPTASLHFTKELLGEIAKAGTGIHHVTLHVGAGTFKPVKTATVAGHNMHGEPFSVSLQTLQALASASTIIAGGTTSLRTLESLYWIGVKCLNELPVQTLRQWEAYELEKRFNKITVAQSLQALIGYLSRAGLDVISCNTSMIIVPGYRFRLPAGLVTNFHQPQSTLLLLISAFIGEDWKKVYDHALKNDYRFLSYGDGSLLWRKEQ